MRTAPPSVVLLLAAPLLAQTYTVSPAAYTNTQGNASNPIPFYNGNARYQQIHGDLRGTPLALQGMSVRRGSGTQNNAMPRMLDLTVILANSDITKTSTTFAANYIGAPWTAMPKTNVSFPDWTQSGGTPEPWSIVIPFTAPYPYLATSDLLWEWRVENNTAPNQSYAADVYSGITADITSATSVTLGAACTATGQGQPMSYGVRCYTSRILRGLYLRGTALYGVTNSPSAILLGSADPNWTIPGLCTTVRTNMLISFPSVATGTAASFSTPDLLVPYDPNWQGLKLYSQAVTSDPGQAGLPFALSAAIENTVPAMTPPGASPLIRIFEMTSATAVSGIVNYYAYGIIVRFRY
jgi:hypothetical protein